MDNMDNQALASTITSGEDDIALTQPIVDPNAPAIQEIVVAKLRGGGIAQSFFTRKRNTSKLKELTVVLNSTWQNSLGQDVKFTANEKKLATKIWGGQA